MFDKNLLDKAQFLFEIANKAQIKIISAESCTGGLLAALITEIAGASQIFQGGVIVYSDQLKEKILGVDKKLLQQYGAVSAQVAEAMAKGAINNFAGDLSIAITGIAGPATDNSAKEIGLVYIASYNKLNEKLLSNKFNFSGNRNQIRIASIASAMDILIQQTNKINYGKN